MRVLLSIEVVEDFSAVFPDPATTVRSSWWLREEWAGPPLVGEVHASA
ncbi:MAG: hypothetical protein OXH85_07000 [Truepera sp.]|nr:hypothetical protein [Truepera sp.]